MSRFSSFSLRKSLLLGLPALIIMVIVLFSGSAYWLLNTSSGASWLWTKLEALDGVDVRSSRVSGDLASGFVISDMEYHSADLDLLVGHTEIEAGIGGKSRSVDQHQFSAGR